MLNRIVVGTLSTLNTLMTPLAGKSGAVVPTYKLEAPEISMRERCPGIKRTFLGLQIASASDADGAIAVRVEGHVCSVRGGMKPVAFQIWLPSDLTDEDFLAHLPTDSAYVAGPVPSANGQSGKARVKITKRKVVGDLIPVHVEWLPNEEGHVEHGPMTIWLKKGGIGLPWQKVEFAELENQVLQPLEVAGEVRPAGLR